jgi:predicted DCC family thiol-disulfide oxidoreductase YuxK
MLTIYYDGDCGLCHRWVRILVANDPRGNKFIFAPIGGGYFRTQIPANKAATLPDSIIVADEAGGIYTKSKAVAETLARIDGVYGFAAKLIRIFPVSIADFFYDIVAKVRQNLFAKPSAACPFMDTERQKRFRLE